MGPELWTVSRIATELNATRARVGRIVASLEPVKKKGRVRYYWLKDVLPRFYGKSEADGSPANAYDLAAQRARQHKEMADKLAMENARTRGDLVSADEVADLVEGLTIEARQRIMMIPARTADELTRLRSRAKIKDLLDSELRDALAGLTEDRAGLPPRLERTGT